MTQAGPLPTSAAPSWSLKARAAPVRARALMHIQVPLEVCRELGFLKLEFLAVVSHSTRVLRFELGPSARTASALNH